MKITDNSRDTNVCFRELTPGDVFKYGPSIFIKIGNAYTQEGNCVLVDNWFLSRVPDEANVIYLSGHLTIERAP